MLAFIGIMVLLCIVGLFCVIVVRSLLVWATRLIIFAVFASPAKLLAAMIWLVLTGIWLLRKHHSWSKAMTPFSLFRWWMVWQIVRTATVSAPHLPLWDWWSSLRLVRTLVPQPSAPTVIESVQTILSPDTLVTQC